MKRATDGEDGKGAGDVKRAALGSEQTSKDVDGAGNGEQQAGEKFASAPEKLSSPALSSGCSWGCGSPALSFSAVASGGAGIDAGGAHSSGSSWPSSATGGFAAVASKASGGDLSGAAAPAAAAGCTWGSGASAAPAAGCSWGGGAAAPGACTWGSSGVSFSSLSAMTGNHFSNTQSNAGDGFAALAAPASATPAAGPFDQPPPSVAAASAFGGSAVPFGGSAQGGSGGEGEAGAVAEEGAEASGGAEAAAPSSPLPSAAEAGTGEEDEVCVHRVRAKLFRLETREMPPVPEAPELPPALRAIAAAKEGADKKEDDDKEEEEEEEEEEDNDDGEGKEQTEEGAKVGAESGAESGAKDGAKSDVAGGVGAKAEAQGDETGKLGTDSERQTAVSEGGNAPDKAASASVTPTKQPGGQEEEEAHSGSAKKASVSTLRAEAPEFVPRANTQSTAGTGSVETGPGGKALQTRWAERGVGQLRLLVSKSSHGAKGSRKAALPRLVMRVESVFRLILNEVLLPDMAPAVRVTDTSMRVAMVSAETLQPVSYLIRVKTPAEADALREAINKHIPKAQ